MRYKMINSFKRNRNRKAGLLVEICFLPIPPKFSIIYSPVEESYTTGSLSGKTTNHNKMQNPNFETIKDYVL